MSCKHNELKHEHITTEGWNAIYYGLDLEADVAQRRMLIPAQKQYFHDEITRF
jgi:hypothetical protein